MKYRVAFTKSFKKEYHSLPVSLRDKVKEQITLLQSGNFSHPSLRLKKMRKTKVEKWEVSITMKYRMTFQIEGDLLTFRAVGKHDILD